MKLLNKIYWFFYKLTKKGKREYTLRQGLKNFEQRNKEANVIKWGIINSASKKLKLKKIITFHKGKSISKSKKTNHQVIEASKKENKEVLAERGLKITNKGKFKSA
ncbi:hypothetical protein [Thalassobellus citreus]|uniref:hypothetical protein n=1 Tax=Thalassobellus citreus TaxID=3367752 RepID=UPI0037906349